MDKMQEQRGYDKIEINEEKFEEGYGLLEKNGDGNVTLDTLIQAAMARAAKMGVIDEWEAVGTTANYIQRSGKYKMEIVFMKCASVQQKEHWTRLILLIKTTPLLNFSFTQNKF